MTESARLFPEQLESLKEALKDHYVIEEEVGVGGMGVVFRAHDIRHERVVAIKVLLPEIAVSLGKERFLREVRIEAGLNHPHILPVYDSGEGGGLLYCVMPFIEGESLSARLKRERQLPCDEALRICREIADALAFAHAHDIIHRDVKPGNILLESGHAVLADFGLAKAVSQAGDDGLTRTGFAVGTPAYSSPEQAAADDGVDGRTDLYSLGCVLYEMLAGQAPFVGPTSDSVVRQHMTANPTSVRILRPAIDEGIEAILDQLLAKSPADRYSSAEALVRALDAAISGEFPSRRKGKGNGARRWQKWLLPTAAGLVLVVAAGSWILSTLSADSSPPEEVSGLNPADLAVLYFEDLSPDGSLGFVADGFTEGVISEFSRVPELTVVSRNGVAPFRGSAAPLDSIARALQVGTIIHGSVEPSGDQIRVTLQLAEGVSGADFERSTFQLPATELLLAQDSLVTEAAWLLRERLGEEVHLRRRQAQTSSVEAWALVQRAERDRKRAEELQRGDDLEAVYAAFGTADSLLALAEAADPAWVEPIQMRGWIAFDESRSATELETLLAAVERGMGHAERALALDPNHARALELRGNLRYWLWWQGVTPDPEEDAALLAGAQEDLESAVRIDPTLASAHARLSGLYYMTADPTASLLSARRAYDADAYLSNTDEVLRRLFNAAYDVGQFTPARWACNEGHARFPEDPTFWRCQILEMTMPGGTPDPDRAWALKEETANHAPMAQRELIDRTAQMFVAEILTLSGLPDSARSVLLRARAGPDVDPARSLAYLEAHVRTELGDYDQAVELLRSLFTGFSEGGGEAADWADHWYWDDLRSHPGFQELVAASR